MITGIVGTSTIIGLGGIGILAFAMDKVFDRIGRQDLKETMNITLGLSLAGFVAYKAWDFIQHVAQVFL